MGLKLMIEIELSNHAFAEDSKSEVVRILKEYCDNVEGSNLDRRRLRDINGNTVGLAEVVEETEENG